MKNNIKYIKRIGIFVLALVISAACAKWETETSPTLESASTVTLAVLSAGDSSVVISFANSSNGYVSLNLYEGTGNAVPTEKDDKEAMLTGNVTSMEYYSAETATGVVSQYTFEGLVQNASYEVMAVGNNSDGVVSEVAVQVVNTSDSNPPVLLGSDPEVGYGEVLAVDGSVVLFFDEPVSYDATKDLTFSEYFDGEDVVAGSVTVDGNAVTVTLGEDLTNRDYVWLSYPEGAFTDASGNLTAEMVTYQDGNQFVGLYWRAVAKEFEAIAITPVEAVVPAGFDIVVSFAEAVNADDVEDGDITLTYDDGTDVLTKSVLASEVSAAGNDLTITQSFSAAPGVEVTLNIPAELLGIGIGNPNAEVTASWSILHPLQAWIGSYDVDAPSYGNPGAWDEVWTATIAPVAGDVNSLAITIDAGGGGGVPFIAAINTTAMTITIAPGTDAGDLYGYGVSTLMYVGDDAATFDMVADLVGTIDTDGTILIDQLTMAIDDGPWVWDAFNTTWTPAAKKRAASRGAGFASKAARF